MGSYNTCPFVTDFFPLAGAPEVHLHCSTWQSFSFCRSQEDWRGDRVSWPGLALRGGSGGRQRWGAVLMPSKRPPATSLLFSKASKGCNWLGNRKPISHPNLHSHSPCLLPRVQDRGVTSFISERQWGAEVGEGLLTFHTAVCICVIRSFSSTPRNYGVGVENGVRLKLEHRCGSLILMPSKPLVCGRRRQRRAGGPVLPSTSGTLPTHPVAVI